jgi:hypothetical protein
MSPSNTPHGYPYPLGSDRLADGDDAMRNLATAIDTRLGVVAGGVVTIPVVAAGTNYNVVVTYPVGRFTALPHVSVTPVGIQANSLRASIRDPLTTGCTIVGSRDNGTATFPVQWMAVYAP